MESRRPPRDADDKRSVVSSFYSGRRSQDILASNQSPIGEHIPLSQQRQDGYYKDDFSPGDENFRGMPPPRASSGYNRDSFARSARTEPVKGLHEEDGQGGGGAGWDVYADFNNAGPRYSQNILMGNSDG